MLIILDSCTGATTFNPSIFLHFFEILRRAGFPANAGRWQFFHRVWHRVSELPATGARPNCVATVCFSWRTRWCDVTVRGGLRRIIGVSDLLSSWRETDRLRSVGTIQL